MNRHIFPWSYLTPAQYRGKARLVYKHCPEIRWHINEIARIRLWNFFKCLPLLIPLVPLALLAWAGERLERGLARWEQPSWSRPEPTDDVLAAASAILSRAEVEERIAPYL